MVTDSERAVAALFEKLGLEFEYEPREFVLSEKTDGRTAEAIRPDFYLPQLDLYVEVTVQRCCTRKRKRVRLLRERYPQVRVVLLTRPDLDLLGTLS